MLENYNKEDENLRGREKETTCLESNRKVTKDESQVESKPEEVRTKVMQQKCDSSKENNFNIQKPKTVVKHRSPRYPNKIILDPNGDDIFICKVKKLAKSEQYICATKNYSQPMDEQEKGVVRVLKCKLIKDECGRDVFVCKEMKPKAAEDKSNQVKSLQTQKLSKQCSTSEFLNQPMSISKKLIRKEEPKMGRNSEGKKKYATFKKLEK
ncbi:hypothetical protein JTB14_011942 [Gonioctena quinquepunctata]|nr:hypothetical protein JTB14_011942 [Gonioctena quinquepunctata]